MTDNKKKAQAVGHIPSGLFVVCVNDNGQKDGYLASWVQQVSFEPLVIAIACKKGRMGYDHITSGKPFSVNVVGAHDMNYMKHFWSGYAPEDNPFAELPHKESQNGCVLLDQAKSVIECKMVSSSDPGDHTIVFAEVLDSHVNNEEADVKVHIRKSGLDY
jgi:flavin reductase (DIM6/NTAB) family NADH-FMN oxidoreductase RutF